MIYSPPVRITSLLVSKLYNTTMEVVRFPPVLGHKNAQMKCVRLLNRGKKKPGLQVTSAQYKGVPLNLYNLTSMCTFSFVFPIISDGREQKHFMNKQEFPYLAIIFYNLMTSMFGSAVIL